MTNVTYSRDEALRLATTLRKWRQNSAHTAADQLRAAAAEIDLALTRIKRLETRQQELLATNTELESTIDGLHRKHKITP